MNNFIKFYTENCISPVSQNLGDLELHFNRRIALYRTLGLNPLFFKGRDVLEVAPGSGHNSIVTATFEMNKYDLVEPNPTGFLKMVDLLKEHQPLSSHISCHNLLLEDFPKDRRYDIVLCEGLVPGLSDPANFLTQLASKVTPGGVLVITCADALSVLFESLRRYLARYIVYKEKQKGNNQKLDSSGVVDILVKAFDTHLNKLKGMSRPSHDWVWDNLLNPASSSLAGVNEFSVKECFDFFGDSFYFYGSNPVMMNNYTWYKNLSSKPREYNEFFETSFISNQLNLLHYKETTAPDYQLSRALHRLSKEFALMVEKRDALNPGEFIADIIERDLIPIKQIKGLLIGSGLDLSLLAITEFLNLFEKNKAHDFNAISEMNYFSEAFGRGQQYISLVKS